MIRDGKERMNRTMDFTDRKTQARGFAPVDRRLPGQIPTLAITPVADGRTGAYEDNQAATWAMVERVACLLEEHVRLYDGLPPRVVVAPEIVYGARTGALAQAHYIREGVCANIWVSRSWAYSDELMSACMGLGSSEWPQAAYGLNQTDRPGAVWLKAFCAAMDEKMRPIFSVYNPDLEDESGPIAPYAAERLLRFARAACAVAEMRGKNYLALGGVSMGIIGSDVRRNMLQNGFGMGTVSVDMSAIRARMDESFLDAEELETAFRVMKRDFAFDFGAGHRPLPPDDLLKACLSMTLIVRDMMIGNPKLADRDVERAQGCHALAAGTQGQRAWTDAHPNFDLTEALLCSSFDWSGRRPPFIVATENDCKNAIGMLAAQLLTGLPQLFADIRTCWTPASVLARTGVSVEESVPDGFIDKRNSGAGALDYAVDPFAIAGLPPSASVHDVAARLRDRPELGQALMEQARAGTLFMGANLQYFPGDGLSSRYRTPGGMPMTAYRYNAIGERWTCSVVEGDTVELPSNVADHVRDTTDPTWPETYWAPRGMSAFEYMNRIGPNHDGNSFGHIGGDLATLNAMLRIPLDMHNVAPEDVFRPTLWDRFGGDDFRACEALGPLYR